MPRMMKKLLFLLMATAFWLCGYAQSERKTRSTASNSQSAVTQRAITGRFNQGLRYYYTAQYEDALQVFSGILADAPKHAPSHFMLSRLYVEKQQFAEAESALKQAVKSDRNNLWYQVALAQMYVADGDYKAAAPMWEKICRHFPENTEFRESEPDLFRKFWTQKFTTRLFPLTMKSLLRRQSFLQRQKVFWWVFLPERH